MTDTKIKQYNLTKGSILQKLLLVALPIIGTQLMQMLYNLADMFWMGRLGTESLAATATCGMYIWLSMGFMILGRMGSEIGVAQSVGSGNIKKAHSYMTNSFLISIILGVFVGAAMIFGHSLLIGFFGIKEIEVVSLAEHYLSISGLGIPFVFMTAVIAGAFTGAGNSKLIFQINIIGIIFNLILDPITIFGLNLGITGAAISNVIGQLLSFILSMLALYRHADRPFEKVKLLVAPRFKEMKQIFCWGVPIMLQDLLYPILSMSITRIVASWGAVAIAAQRIGTQAESLTWLIAGGFCMATTSFIGQNYGANRLDRINKGMRLALIMLTIYGLIVTAILYFGGGLIAHIFTNDPAVIDLSMKYLRIAAFCQLASCLEPLFAGYFRGIGQTVSPSVISILGNISRCVVAFVFAHLGFGFITLSWVITIGAIVRSLMLVIWYLLKRKKEVTK